MPVPLGNPQLSEGEEGSVEAGCAGTKPKKLDVGILAILGVITCPLSPNRKRYKSSNARLVSLLLEGLLLAIDVLVLSELAIISVTQRRVGDWCHGTATIQVNGWIVMLRLL